MIRLSGVVLLLVLQAIFSFETKAASPYKLGIVLVVDQFRADYLTRFEDDFLSSSSSKGFRFLMEKGSYYPLADHGLFQNMTCPGHANILTGTYPYRHGISMNYWYNRTTKKDEYCAEDSAFPLVGQAGVQGGAQEEVGASPKNLRATTVGDELKNIDRKSKVVSIAVKDRSAIMLGGKRADEVFWFKEKPCEWQTSTYYQKELPQWVKKENERVKSFKNKKLTWAHFKDIEYCSKDSIRTPWAVENTFELAKEAIKNLKLGQGPEFDLLTISLSSHDYLGHAIGPNHESMKAMSVAEDRLISDFLNFVSEQVPGGLNQVFVVLTGDHGSPPSPDALPKEKIKTENVRYKQITPILENLITEKFGKPKGGKWVSFVDELQYYLSPEALKGAKVSAVEVVHAIRPPLMKERFVEHVYARDEIMLDRKVPPRELGVVLDRSLNDRSGDLLMVLTPYYYSSSDYVTHMTHYSYDRYVPLVFYGKTFKPGVRREITEVINIAPTLSSVLGVIPPVQSEGKVLAEIIKN